MKLKYVNPFKMEDGDDPSLTLGKEYEFQKHYGYWYVTDDVGIEHRLDHPEDAPTYHDFDVNDYFELIN
tara:strand:+ start:1615 stop:1821 length:207 start_codon:yes stop_codon:yes gene_type:complete